MIVFNFFVCFFQFWSFNSSCYIFVWCNFFLSWPISQETSRTDVKWKYNPSWLFIGSCYLDSSLLLILPPCLFFFTFLIFECCDVWCERHGFLGTFYVLVHLRRWHIFSTKATSSYWFALFLLCSVGQYQMGSAFRAWCALKD